MCLFVVKTMTHSLYINSSHKQWVSTLWRMRDVMWYANTVYKLWKFNTCVANGRIGRWKWRHEVSRVIASCAGWHDADGRMLSFSYYFEPRNCRIGEQWCTCRMGRRDGHSRTYPAMFLYVQSHGLRELYGLPGTWVNLHMCDSEIYLETNRFGKVMLIVVNKVKQSRYRPGVAQRVPGS